MKTTKYNYLKVIQQYYSDSYGWEDASEYVANSNGTVKNRIEFLEDLKEYKLMGYPTRVIFRRQ